MGLEVRNLKVRGKRSEFSRVRDEAPRIKIESQKPEVSEIKAFARVTGSWGQRASISKTIQGVIDPQCQRSKVRNSKIRGPWDPGDKGQFRVRDPIALSLYTSATTPIGI